ncbi:MAG: ADP-forming succinate--CoA ligase subunit beta [Rhodospirillaceae bacterium]|jgi:succinyl-CoA synthetase beta subunit|nr:ADP-forming succinate--CoA ligase subunit beta [Rhodospirillaceae bacterium]
MNIHEYQAKKLLKKYGVEILRGSVAYTVDEAEQVVRNLGGSSWVIKSQIHAGGRGKGKFKDKENETGGIRVVKSIKEVCDNTKSMLGQILITNQTGVVGKKVNCVYIEEGCDIKRELYLGLMIDRSTSRITVIASKEGGVEIEDVAAINPEKIIKVAIDPAQGFQNYYGRRVAFNLDLEYKQIDTMIKLIGSLYRAFIELDASTIEINPLVVTSTNDIIALDAKINFDNTALFRHHELEELRDESEENLIELEASRYGLNYIKLDGQIGCMVNGAGLAMATMDIIKLYGSKPANFLDVGGGATKEQVIKAFKLILSDPDVKGILINIFGGIMRCDLIAESIIAGAKEVNNIGVPLVIRLEGTNIELGKKIFLQSKLPIVVTTNLADAAEKIVKAVKRYSNGYSCQ